MIYLAARELPVAGCPVVTNHMPTRGAFANPDQQNERWAQARQINGTYCKYRDRAAVVSQACFYECAFHNDQVGMVRCILDYGALYFQAHIDPNVSQKDPEKEAKQGKLSAILLHLQVQSLLLPLS
jgi:hypothetical protein